MADGYVLNRELLDLIRREISRQANSFQPRPKGELRGRRVTGGSELENLTSWALVTLGADANYGSIGKCVLENEDGVPLGADGEPLILNSADPEYDEGLVNEVEIEFKTPDFCNIPVGWRVQLSATRPITPGSTWESNKVRGAGVLPPCFTETVVTDVDCVEGEIVVTDTELSGLECIETRAFPALPE